MKTINLVCENFYPLRTAPANRAFSLAKMLADSHQVNVIYLNDSGLVDDKEGFIEQVGELHSQINLVPVKANDYKNKDGLSRLFKEVANAAKLIKQDRAFKVELSIVSIPFMMLLPIAALQSLFSSRRYVLEVRDLIWRYFEYKTGWINKLISNVLTVICTTSIRSFDHVVTVTEGQKNGIRKYNKNIQVIGNGLDASAFSKLSTLSDMPDSFTVTYAGSIGYPQNLSVLVDAAKILHQKNVDIRVNICGGGREVEHLKNIKTDNVHFLGKLNFEQLCDTYQNSSVLYAQLRNIPSLTTAEPTKTFEYAAMGKPMLLGYQGNAYELSKQFENATLIEPDNAEVLAETLHKLKAQESLTISVADKELIKSNFIRESLISKYTPIIDNLF